MSDLSRRDSQTDKAGARGTVGGNGEEPGSADSRIAKEEDISRYFTATDIDTLGEIGNICMGTSATTLYSLLGHRVTITTPQVAMYKAEDVLSPYRCPFLAVSVEFVEGIHGKNLLILKEYDAALITDLLMGGDGQVDQDNIVLNEIHFSAMSEFMNQMIGSSATAMSNMVGSPVNISPPTASRIEYYDSVAGLLDGASPIVKISFDMEIEGLLKSKLLQIMSIDMARDLIGSLTQPDEPENENIEKGKIPINTSQPEAPTGSGRRSDSPVRDEQRLKSVKQPSFQSFDEKPEKPAANKSGSSDFDLISDIPLQVTVELGKAKKNLGDILNLGIGSIVVLDKQAGDLVEVIANGKRIAKGEVVVIDENYGVRITEIVKSGGSAG